MRDQCARSRSSSSCSASASRADSAAQIARSHFRSGTQAFDLGHYDEAAKEFEAAYRAKEDPSLLFNLAQAYRQGGHNVDAVRVYKSFLHHVPDAPNRADVEQRIASLEKAIEEQRRAKDGPPEGTLAPARTQGDEPSATPPATPSSSPGAVTLAPPVPWYKDPMAMALGGVGVAAFAVGAGLAIDGAALQTQSDSSADLQTRADLHDRADKFKIAGGVTAGAGVLLLAGSVLRLATRKKASPPFVFNFNAGPRLIGAAVQGSF